VPSKPYRVILDTNIVVRAFINLASPSGQILKACERRQILAILSAEVLTEYRAILRRPSLLERYPELEKPEVDVSVERLIYISDFYRRVGVRFPFPRDPKDAPFLELAIAGRATHLITTDQDLLGLAGGRDEASKRFRKRAPGVSLLRPEAFIEHHGDSLAAVN
jgi:putative PIN family toxin of toxin-antitoxin system